ncbi:MAG: Mur ligase family protein [Patescibacteria group bacterium]|nr:Mur ligase family protein [Patescibacteria group bacterium]
MIQLKDYFFPSLWAHFDYPSNYKIFFRFREIILLISWLIILSLSLKLGKFSLIDIDLVYLLFALIILIFLRKNSLRIIKWSLKGIFISVLIIFINYQILNLTQNDLSIIILLLTSSIQFSITVFALFIANILTYIYAQKIFTEAKEKIKKWKKEDSKRLIIGIGGSYGKTSTKEILSYLLEEKYKVLKSPLRLNAEIGLARFILKENLDDYDILVLELGTRKEGEIKKLVEIFSPQWIILTGLAPQHLATFGSFEKMIKGETEILSNLPANGSAFFNGQDEEVKKIYQNFDFKNKYLYGSKDSYFYFKDENFTLEETEFTFVYPEGEERLKTNLIGNHFLENLTGCLGVCFLLNIKPYELRERLLNLRLLPNQFEIIKKNNPLIINDSYNANVVGVKKEIEFLNKIWEGNKILLFGGILELGKETENIYYSLIHYFNFFDKVILTFEDYTEIFEKKLGEKIIIYQNQKLDEILKNFETSNLAILILGRIPFKLLFEIKKL